MSPETLKPWLERADCRVGEDKFDTHVLANHGVRLAGCVHDTLLESYVLEVHEKHELAMLAQRHCGRAIASRDELTGKGAGHVLRSRSCARHRVCGAADRLLAVAARPSSGGSRTTRSSISSTSASRCRCCRCSGAWRGTAFSSTVRGSRPRATSLEERSRRKRKPIPAAGQPFNSGLAQADPGDPVRAAEAPGEEEDPSGQPRRTRICSPSLRSIIRCPGSSSSTRALSKLKSTYTDKLPKSINARTGRAHDLLADHRDGQAFSNEPNLQNIPIRTRPAGAFASASSRRRARRSFRPTIRRSS